MLTPRARALHSQRTYHLENLIARGGFGQVYRAWFEQPDGTRCTCAVKCLLPQHVQDANMRRRFEQEAILAYRVSADHPHLVPLRDYCFRDSSNPFLVFDFVDGPSLFAVKGALRGKFELVRAIAHDLLSALEHVHESGLIHRDVSPANVLLAPGGIAMLTDLGFAKPAVATPSLNVLGVPCPSGEPA